MDSQSHSGQHKKRQALGRRFWNLLGKLPMFLRARVIRNFFSIESNLPDDLIFKRAETYDEIEQAFHVAYEGFRERGLVPDSESKLRVTKYHALPTTIILIVKQGQEVIATMSIVVDSPLGLPLEKLWNVAEIKKASARCAELSTLAIKKGHRSKRGLLLLPLCKFMKDYCLDYLGVDCTLMAVHPEIKEFYRCILMATMIGDGKPKSYDFVQGAEAVGLYLKYDRDLETRVQRVYGRKKDSKNIYKFFYQTRIKNFIFPARDFFKSSFVTFSPSLLEYFFFSETQTLAEISSEEKSMLSNLYFYPRYRSVIGVRPDETESFDRSEPRFLVLCKARFNRLGDTKVVPATVLEVSRRGIKIRLPVGTGLAPESSFVVSLQVSPEQKVAVRGTIVWESKSLNQLGLEIQPDASRDWEMFIDYLESDLAQLDAIGIPGRKTA